MARRRRNAPPKYETGKEVTTKSWFGSHADMVVGLEELQSGCLTQNTFLQEAERTSYLCVCKDDKGYYITERSHLDNGLADPNRYSNLREIQ